MILYRVSLSVFLITSILEVISIICIIFKKAYYTLKHEKEPQFNNNIKNKALMSPSQYSLVICIFLLSVAPNMFITESLLKSNPWLGTLKETIFQLGSSVMGPMLFFIFNENARRHIKVEFWDWAPDWLHRLNPNRVEQIELNQGNVTPLQ